jgi:hypothetical protein
MIDRSNNPVYHRQLSSLVEGTEDFDKDEHPDLDPADAKIRMQPGMLEEVTKAVTEANRANK